GAGRHQRRAILQARERGLRVVAVDRSADAPGLAAADVAETVGLMDVDAGTEGAARHRGDGALTVSADRALPVVAAVPERPAAGAADDRVGDGTSDDAQDRHAAHVRGGRRAAAALRGCPRPA